MTKFQIGINMPGAISAGAYTAGVLDFLIEALDEWYAAKDSYRKGQGPAVPMHDVCIPVFSGASAGGMCAAISSMLVQGDFQHIHDATHQKQTGTNNRFYETWVNTIDIVKLLGIDDLQGDGPAESLLDCTIIDEIAEVALEPNTPKPRDYISKDLNLFLTLTNMTGIPYALGGVVDEPSLEETALYHADRIRFQTVSNGGKTVDPTAKPLPINDMKHPNWDLLRTAAKATGAVPIALRPRAIMREQVDYAKPLWDPINAPTQPDAIQPSWPANAPNPFQTINVDGGVIDNDPFVLAHQYLEFLHGRGPDDKNPRGAKEADCAVLSISPFPTRMKFDTKENYTKDAAVQAAFGELLSTVIGSSRFFGESLSLITQGDVFSRFMIAPSPIHQKERVEQALECSTLGAFGGFFDVSFRRHDFQLGRINCQQFLRKRFVLPDENPIIDAGLPKDPNLREKLVKDFGQQQPPNKNPNIQKWKNWVSIIPLCGSSREKEPDPAPGLLTNDNLKNIIGLVYPRLGGLLPKLMHKDSVIAHVVDKLVEMFHPKSKRLEAVLRAEFGSLVEPE